MTGFIQARADVENFGYRAPSCLVTDTAGITVLSTALLAAGEPPVPNLLLAPANINSLHRTNVSRPQPMSGGGCSAGASGWRTEARRRPPRVKRPSTLP